MRQLLPEPASAPDLYEVYGRDWLEPGGLRVNFVVSLDGAVSVNGISAPLQTPGDNAVFAVLRDLADVVLVGRGTITGEGYGPLTPDPRRAAVRPPAAWPPTCRWRSSAPGSTSTRTMPCSTRPPARRGPSSSPASRRRRPAGPAAGPGRRNRGRGRHRRPAATRLQLEARGLRRILSEGGPTLLTSLLAAFARGRVVPHRCAAARRAGRRADRGRTSVARSAPRPDRQPLGGGRRAVLPFRHRADGLSGAVLLAKTDGLDATSTRLRLPTSELSLGGC